MLARLKKRLKKLAGKIRGWDRRIAKASKRVETLGVQIDRLEVRFEDLVGQADRSRRNGNHEQARRLDGRALKVAGKLGAKKQQRRFWVGRTKSLRIEKRGFAETLAELNTEIKKLEASKVRFHVDENKVTGGSQKDRFIGACLLSAKRCGAGERPNFYSQPGRYTTDKVFTGESPGDRSDCSQWVTSTARAAGLDDPNGTGFVGGGYTGTLLQGHGKWRETDRDTFVKRGWGYCVYGTGTGFHVEAFVGGTKTIGHGDAQINEGYLDMFSPRTYFIYG